MVKKEESRVFIGKIPSLRRETTIPHACPTINRM